MDAPVVSTTGAGDCFNAALAVHFAECGDCLKSVKYAIVASNISVMRPGVIASLPYRKDVEQIIQQFGIHNDLY